MRFSKLIIQKIHTLIWFLCRPIFWQHALHLTRRKFLTNLDAPLLRENALKWAAENTIPYKEALKKLEINGDMKGIDDDILKEGEELASKSLVKMGGPGNLNLLFDAVRLTGANRIIETGVAYGWSSLAILNAITLNGNGKLYSVDMPYPKMGNEPYVGVVIPERLRDKWILLREPDRRGLEKAIDMAGGKVDLCHYDSDKSWWGRHYAFPILWKALIPGGLLISDDIQDNMYFKEFVMSKMLPFAVTKSNDKFVGLIRKEKER